MFKPHAVVKALEGHKEELQEELRKIELALNALLPGRSNRTGRRSARKASGKRRVLSAEARQRIGRATRRRWALARKEKKAAAAKK
jgi:hypothetical protein